MPKLTKYDALIVVCVLLLAAACFVFSTFIFSDSGKGEATVEIYIDNSLYAEYPLSSEQFITLKLDDSQKCEIEITGGGVRMYSSSCPDKLCERSGLLTVEKAATSDLASWIVCLPNSVSIHLCTEGKK
ncbi:MAG: NusG domain II-containing protein [Clostridia bacterium]|nr:NusG domain II-containing protein [Clostridia bacterium]